jgi:hypothetical protein
VIGAILIILLSVFVSARLKSHMPAARVALGFVVGIGAPLLAIALLGRTGLHAGSYSVIGVFVVLTGLVFAATAGQKSVNDDPRWLGIYGASFLIAAITALVGRSPTIGVLIDPWAHMAWSRDLTDAYRFYPSGFPALDAILRTDNGLVGVFRMAPTILHAAFAAQFFALGECAENKDRSVFPQTGLLVSLAAIAYLIVPAAFGKFDPPRPELLAAVFIAASWWVLIAGGQSIVFKSMMLGFLTCAAFVAHFSNLEIAHILALGLTIIFGNSREPFRRRILLIGAVGIGLVVSLAISPWPLTLIFNRDALPYAAVFHSNVAIPHPVAVARMLGPGLSVAGAACVIWIIWRIKTAYRRLNSALVGLSVFGVVVVLPLFVAAAGIDIPISLSVYRFFLAAALPLAILVGLTSVLARECSTVGRLCAVICFSFLGLDIALRAASKAPLFAGVTVILIILWWQLTRSHTPKRSGFVAIVAAVALVSAVAVRLAVWFPHPPAEAVWLTTKGDPNVPVVTNWPLTNALDALVDQPVIDGLAGNDGNVARHRTMILSPLHDRVAWCGEETASGVNSLIAVLEELDNLPAYLIVGDRFAESWRLYSEQHERRVEMGDIEDYPFYAAPPCKDPPTERIGRINTAIAAHPRVSLEFKGDNIAVYRIE